MEPQRRRALFAMSVATFLCCSSLHAQPPTRGEDEARLSIGSAWSQPHAGRPAPRLGPLAPQAILRRTDPAWPRVVIADVYLRHAARRALAGAADWLAHPSCEEVFSEFSDRTGRPLTASLKRLEVAGPSYLQLLMVLDAIDEGPCRENALAFTAIGSRVVRLCGREFERAWRRDARLAQAVVIHEALHSLGLAENPPSSTYITHRVSTLCWR